MTAVYCYRKDCINRSNKKSQMKNKAGKTMYRCTKDHLTITSFTDFNGIGILDAEPEVCKCLNYRSKEEY